jgi:hypothetical protein
MKHYLGICLVLLTLTLIVLGTIYGCSVIADRTVDHVVNAFAQVFQVRPQITVNQKVIFTQTAPIAELAVVTKEEQVSLEFDTSYQVFSQTVPLTEKKLTAQAVYRIKAGFDLREPFSVEIDPKTHAIRAKLPPAKILSVEQVGDLSLVGEDGWLDRVNDTDRMQILDSLQKAARSQAENSGLKEDAQKQAQARLEEILRHNGENVELEWTNSTTKTML